MLWFWSDCVSRALSAIMTECASSRESHMHAQEVLADRIFSARLASGLTQNELGRQVGRDQTFISKVEGLERRLGVIEFVQITDALRTDPLAILSAVSNALRQEN